MSPVINAWVNLAIVAGPSVPYWYAVHNWWWHHNATASFLVFANGGMLLGAWASLFICKWIIVSRLRKDR